ncbi:MAG: hypothetical protein K2G70_02500, partial [Turicibacter sp.]|nr:hypothetical protein [Turicibacter sp.]
CELVARLLEYKNNREILIAKLKSVYTAISMNLPTLEKDHLLRDIDPFTIFGLFNKGIKDENRIKIIKGLANEFSISAKVPEQFDGIPVLNNQKATFYYFIGECEKWDIDNLWHLFEAALNYAEDSTVENEANFIKYYDKSLDQRGIHWNITVGLYWIRPYNFINLDSVNRVFMINSKNMPNDFISFLDGLKQVPSGAQYLKICKSCRHILESGNYSYHNFPDLSYFAWLETSNHDEMTDDILSDPKDDSVRYWIYSPGNDATMWDEFYQEGIIAIGWGEIGDLTSFSSKEQMKKAMKQCYNEDISYINRAHATWQFVHEVKPGDIIFVKRGLSTVIGRGVVTSDYQYHSKRKDSFKNIRLIHWTHRGIWEHPGKAVSKALTDITPYTEYVEKLKALFEEGIGEDTEEQAVSYPIYGESDFLADVYMSQENYYTLTSLLRYKKMLLCKGRQVLEKLMQRKG